jgi:hypothetical protein
MMGKYPVLVAISGIMRVVGWILVALGALLVIIAMILMASNNNGNPFASLGARAFSE